MSKDNKNIIYKSLSRVLIYMAWNPCKLSKVQLLLTKMVFLEEIKNETIRNMMEMETNIMEKAVSNFQSNIKTNWHKKESSRMDTVRK